MFTEIDDLRTASTQIWEELRTAKNIHVIIHEIFKTDFYKSSYPIPSFVLQLLILKTGDKFWNFLQNKTPYLSPFSIDLMQEVIRKVKNIDAEEIFTHYKKFLYGIQKKNILLLMEEFQLQENYIDIVLKMKSHFDFYSYEGFNAKLHSIASQIFHLKILPFPKYYDTEKKIRFLIPKNCVSRAIQIATSQRNVFESNDIESILIGSCILQAPQNDEIMLHDSSNMSGMCTYVL